MHFRSNLNYLKLSYRNYPEHPLAIFSVFGAKFVFWNFWNRSLYEIFARDFNFRFKSNKVRAKKKCCPVSDFLAIKYTYNCETQFSVCLYPVLVFYVHNLNITFVNQKPIELWEPLLMTRYLWAKSYEKLKLGTQIKLILKPNLSLCKACIYVLLYLCVATIIIW